MNEEISEIQDQPLFVCNTVVDIHSQEEATGIAMKQKLKTANLVVYGLCLLMAVYLVIDTIRTGDLIKNLILLVLTAALLIYILISRKTAPKKALLKWEMAIRRKYGSNGLHLTTEFYERTLAQTLLEDEEQFTCEGYSSILEIKESENLFLLRHGREQYYFVSKTGFTKGDPKKFREFIEQRIGGK